MITIYQKTILDLIKVKNKIIEIKHNLENNQKLIITLDTETTGKYYNKFQIENTGIDIVDKIVEFGAIFSIQNVDYYGFETIVPIEDTIFNENPDLGFRIFVNPFIDNHKPFHITMPKEPFDIHGISLEFLEAKTIMECSNEILSEQAPSLLNKYIIDNVESSYIKEIIEMINLCDILIAHNAPFDVGMINEAINDYNKLNEDKLNFISCEIIDTLKLFKNEFPKEKLISMQEENEPKEINHKLDYMMYLSGINERNVHGAYWDSKLLIDSYSVLLEKYFTKNFMKDIVEKQTKYLSTLKIDNFESLKEQINHLFYTYVNDLSYLDFDSIKNHLELQLSNVNKQKRNEILKNQIDISIIYYKVFITLNNEVVDMETLKNKVEKMTTKKPNKVIDDIKKSKLFTKEEIQDLIDNQEQMSHYLTQAVFYYFENKFNNEIIEPLIKSEYNKILELTKENTILNIEKNKVYTYFRTDGSIATKDNSLTTIIGSISDLKTFFKKENYLGNDRVVCMDFNSMVNYIRVEKYLKDVNDTLENKININYGITTLLKLELNNEIIDFEINIIAKNNQGIREIPQIIAKAYSDKTMNENSYQNPYLSLEQFVELNNNDNLFVTLGSYQGLMEKVLFTENIEDKFNLSKVGLIRSLLSILLANNSKLNFEFYPCDKFLHNFKYKFLSEYEDINYIFTNPKIYLENDLEYHMVRCYKYNENIYKLNNLNIFKNIEIKDELNNDFVSLDLEYCEKFPKDKVNIPGLIENLEFIKERRPNLYNELKELVDENGELYNLDDNSKENVAKIQKRYFTVKAYEFLEQRFIDNEIREEIKPFYRKRFDFELEVINNMNFDGYTLLVSDFLNVLSNYIGGLIGPGRGCLTKDALVYTYNDNKLSFKSIDNIIVGDKVITHNNLIKEVKETFVYDINEELVQIDTFYTDQTNPIILTKDHKIYVGNNIWKQAKDVSNDDYLYLPIPKYKIKKIKNFDLSKYNKFNAIVNDETITYTYSQNKNNEFCFKDLESKLNVDRRIVKKLFLSIQENKEFKNSKKDILINYILTKFDSLIDWYNYIDSLNKRIINRYLNNDYYFRKFIGRWIGDGSIRSDLNRACVNIVFNKNCIKDINETITFIENNKFDYTIKYIDNHCRIDINDKFLHLFINDIFKDYKFESNTKHFPKFVFNLNKNEIKDVIDGYVSADGYIEEKYNRIKTSSVSYRLSLELKQLLLQIGLPCGIREVKESLISKIKLKKGNKYYVNTFPIFKIEKTKYEIENDFIKLKVRNIINIEKTNTKVYDFTVEDEHSYTTNNYIVHNSAAGSLVSWAYKITNVDPMLEYNKPEKHLLFERYLNPERVSLPDIDMDMNGLLNKDLLLNKIDVEGIDTTIKNFIDIIKSKYENDEFIAGKSLIEDYQIALYGSDKVAKIVTRDTYQAKSAIAAVCKYLGNDFAEDSGFKLKGDNPYIDFSSRISGSAFTKPGIGFKDVFDVSSKFYNPYFVNLYYSNYHVKKVVDLARKLEGTIANYGVHAAGVLILDPKNNYLNNGYMVIGGVNVSLLDGKFVEDYINIKFDFLGLASLEEIEKSLYFIEKLRGKDFKDEIYRTINNEYVLYEDQYTFEKVFDNQNTKKIFQFSSDGMQDLVKRVEPKCFEDLVAITALYRPGPMESGMVDMYVKNKHEPDNIFYEFEELEEILNLTYGNLVYQEQIMKIVQVLGGFSLGGADLVRRAMGKKIKEEMDKLKGQFIDGTVKTYGNRHLTLTTLERFAISQSIILYYDGENILLNSIKDMNELGLEEKFSDKDYGRLIVKKGCKVELDETYITKLLANNLFENIVKFAGYGFNKSHAYAYTNVSMQMAYLKAHFPLEFFASILFNNADDIEKLSEYIIDAKKNNIEIVGPNINLSSYQFDIIEDKIIYGLSNIKGISSKDIKKIIDERNQNGLFKDIGDFLQRFIINLNGSFKTLENLIYSGVLDSLSINKDTIKKFLYSYNLFTLPINEDKEIYLERLNNKKEFIKSLFILDSKYNEEENILNNCLNIFSLENNNLFPLLMEKLLKSKLSTSEKLFVKELDVSTMNAKDSKKYLKDMEKNVLNKEKYVNELKEHFDLIEDMNNYICYDLIDDSIERNRVVMLNLISIIENNSIDDKIIESLNKDIKKNKSIIYLSNSEYVNIGSVSNIGSILDKEYIFEDFKGVPKLNLMYEPFKIEGSYQYRSSIKDIISGVNDNDEAYMSLLILDINCMEHRLYLSQDQIFRYKNNLSIGDPIIFDVDITLNKDKYYKKLINILVLKEKNSVWESLDVFKLPLLSIKDLDKDKIRKKVSLKAEFCTLEEIKEDWIKSTKNWPGIEEGNKQVVLILVSYKQITTKDGREFQILEVSDGIGYETIELLYSKLNLQELEKGIRNPIVIELGKRVDNGYGIGAAYKSNIVFLDETYVLSSKEERYEYSENVNELLDGKEHINVYTKGRTTLGRALSNFSEISTKVVHNNSLYEFKTLEGYWFFLKLFLLTNEEHFEFLNMNGFESKNHGSHLTKSLDKLNEEQEQEFREKIRLALYSKIFNNDNLINQMKENKLIYLHYYNYNGRIRVLPEFDWLVDIINNIAKELHKVD